MPPAQVLDTEELPGRWTAVMHAELDFCLDYMDAINLGALASGEATVLRLSAVSAVQVIPAPPLAARALARDRRAASLCLEG